MLKLVQMELEKKMFDKLSDYFEGATAKYLSAVDADLKKSNQHEIGGLVKAGFSQYLGKPSNGDKFHFNSKIIYLQDEDQDPVSSEVTMSWYDTRYQDKNRAPEYRLYYQTNPACSMMKEGDFFLIIRMKDNSLLIIITPAGTSIEQQLCMLFNIQMKNKGFSEISITDKSISLPVRMLLEDIGIVIEPPESKSEQFLQELLNIFPDGFPKVKEFSELARSRTPGDPLSAPDETLMSWLEQEEMIFRAYERHIVAKKLKEGFGEHGDDVDEFISFSLSVQNRRKSRVGHAFENHLNEIFTLHSISFQQGTSKLTTENKAKPDFIFPSFSSYHDPSFPAENLRLLGAKTTCKDRWRQVLAEGDRVVKKHLITIQPGISTHQLDEMNSKQLQLVVPGPVQSTYPQLFRPGLQSLDDFIKEIKSCQL